jgi:hypothetical protein
VRRPRLSPGKVAFSRARSAACVLQKGVIYNGIVPDRKCGGRNWGRAQWTYDARPPPSVAFPLPRTDLNCDAVRDPKVSSKAELLQEPRDDLEYIDEVHELGEPGACAFGIESRI